MAVMGETLRGRRYFSTAAAAGKMEDDESREHRPEAGEGFERLFP
jgi:hypothetical protein